MNDAKQLEDRQLKNERILIEILRGSAAKPKSKIDQLRADVNDIKLRNRLKVVK